jgi:hypothetical protein
MTSFLFQRRKRQQKEARRRRREEAESRRHTLETKIDGRERFLAEVRQNRYLCAMLMPHPRLVVV